MASKDISNERRRWPLCTSTTIKAYFMKTIAILQLSYAKKFRPPACLVSGKTKIKNTYLTQSSSTDRNFRKNLKKNIIQNIESDPRPTQPSIRIKMNGDEISDDEIVTEEIKRFISVPGKRSSEPHVRQKNELGITDRPVKSNEYYVQRSTLILVEHAEEDVSMSIEAIQSYPTYEFVPKAKTQSMPKMPTPKIIPKSLWSPRGFRFRNGGKRRGTFMTRKQVLPSTDEESSLQTEEKIGFDCIATTPDHSRVVLRRNDTYESKLQKSEQLDEKRLSALEGEYGHELRECYSNSGSIPASIEVLMTKLGSTSFASKVPKGTHHRDVSIRRTCQYTECNRFLSTFTTGFGLNSSRISSGCDDGNDMLTSYWKNITSRQIVTYSKGSFYSSHSISASGSSSETSGSSSSEDKDGYEDECEDDDCGSFSLSSNSTISTHASLANKVWGATVTFSETFIDAGRESDFE